MAANLADIGIQSISAALVQRLTSEVSLEESEVVLDSDGTFGHAQFFDPTKSFRIVGKGDFPSAITIGDAPTASFSAFSGGVSIVNEIVENKGNTEFEGWEIGGMNYPGAS